MTHINKFGLERSIDAATKREVRKRCGFGCVICGSLFCDYHHVEEFHGVQSHDPLQIILLCKNHHGDVTGSDKNRRISNETLQKYIDLPYGIRGREVKWDNLTETVSVKFGNTLFLNIKTVLRINDLVVVELYKMIGDIPVISLNACFTDQDGNKLLEIKDNLVIGNTDVWDFESSGNTIQINSGSHKIDLKVVFHNDGVLEIERLKMWYQGGKIEVMPNGSLIASCNGKEYSKSSEARVQGADVGFEIKDGVLQYGKSERTVFKEGASDPRTRISPRKIREENSSVYSVGDPKLLPNNDEKSFDYSGSIAGYDVSIKGMKYTGDLTALETDGGSIGIGISNDPENIVYGEEIKITKKI